MGQNEAKRAAVPTHQLLSPCTQILQGFTPLKAGPGAGFLLPPTPFNPCFTFITEAASPSPPLG